MIVSWVEVCARRLDRHALSIPGAGVAEVVAAMCGAHAQVLSAAEMSVGLRLKSATRVDVRDALWTERTIVKTFGPRGTVHLLPAQDLPMWTGALSAVPRGRNPMPKDAQLTPEQTDELIEAIGVVLADTELTVDELTDALVEATGPWAGDLVMPAFQGMWPRWRQAVDTAANRGALCFGVNKGRKVTYTHPGRWLPGFRPADGKTAVTELVRRYLYTYGPATPQHFAQWLSAPRTWATEVFASLDLDRVEMEGSSAWVWAGDTEFPSTVDDGVRLLPYFDAYSVGCHPRELVFPGRAAERGLNGGQAGNMSVVLLGGVVAGVWHQRRSGRKLHVTVELFEKLSAAQSRALDEQVERVGEILEGNPELTLGTVTVGAHA